MSPAKEPRKGFLGFMDRLIVLLDGVKGIAMIAAALSVGGASGTLLASDSDTADKLDSLAVRQDSVEARQERTEERVTSMEQRQMDMFTAQVEADTALRAVLERRAANKQKAAQERAVVEKLINLGGNP